MRSLPFLSAAASGILLSAFAAVPLHANPVSLLLKPTGNIVLTTGSFGELVVEPVVVDNATGEWRGAECVSPFDPEEGLSVSGTGKFKFSGGEVLTLVLEARIEGKTVSVRGEWQGAENALGFVRLDLFIGADVAAELSGETVLPNVRLGPLSENNNGHSHPGTAFDFTNTATGASAFRLENAGDAVAGFSLVPEASLLMDGRNGCMLRVTPSPDGSETRTVGDNSSQAWRLVFGE